MVFVCDEAWPGVADLLPGMRRRAKVCEITGLDPEAAAERVRAHSPDGIVTFSEYCLGEAVGLAARLGLTYHDERTGLLLTDKLAQRAALAAAGVDATRCLPAGTLGEAMEAAHSLGYPVVVKPRSGAGSRNTIRVDSEAEARRLLPHVLCGEAGQDRRFVVEECLLGDPGQAGEAWGDYVSVEALVRHGEVISSCVSGKTPLAEPFRETGFLVPSTLPPALVSAVQSLAAAAVHAVGIRDAVTHTEVKLTRDGPRIIEVNGRAGGHVFDLVPRVSGVSLVRSALELSLGRAPGSAAFTFEGVAFEWLLLAPVGACELIELRGVDDVARLEGVAGIDVLAAAGDPVDWRIGNQKLALVRGLAKDHEQLRLLLAAIAGTLVSTYREFPLESLASLVQAATDCESAC